MPIGGLSCQKYNDSKPTGTSAIITDLAKSAAGSNNASFFIIYNFAFGYSLLAKLAFREFQEAVKSLKTKKTKAYRRSPKILLTCTERKPQRWC